MSFPGHLKSLNLTGKRNHASEVAGLAIEEGEIVVRDKDSPTIPYITSGSVRSAPRPILDVDRIIDEKGNGPSRSLWVGNIPPRTTTFELRVLFNRFGVITSTKPMAKYAFVNFEKLESAITAFKECHDRDIFETGCSTINIRFTVSQVESKYVKDDVWEQRNSVSMKAQAAQKQYFQPLASSKDNTTGESASKIEWPHGKPPSGPKSQRKEVSPPPLRRSDCYRPAELSRDDSLRSDFDPRRPDRKKLRRGRGNIRRSSQHYSPAYSLSRSSSSDRSRSDRSVSRDHRHQGEESPLPWEREGQRSSYPEVPSAKKSGILASGNEQLQGLRVRIDEDEASQHFAVQETMDEVNDHAKSQHDQTIVPSVDNRRTDATHEEPQKCRPEPVIEPTRCSPEPLAPVPLSKQYSISPLLNPIGLLRSRNEITRGSSVLSEVATSSSRTSVKKNRCYDCKRPANDLSPLVPCSRCTKKFHSGCGDPKPSSCVDKSSFVCGRCQRHPETRKLLADVNTENTHNALTRSDEKIYLVSPPLSLSHDGAGSNNLSPRDDLSRTSPDKQRLESFFPRGGNTTEVIHAQCEVVETVQNIKDHTKTVSSTGAQSAQRSSQHMTDTFSKSGQLESNERALDKKYKVVTCKWWAAGHCDQTEEGCYYSHQVTAIGFPDRRRANKSWTCHDWLNARCVLSEQECLYAHEETGLHIWKDGRPSFKHVTCFWWSRGRCKWAEDFCKFAHRDTGLYSLDPSETRQVGSKFSMVHPFEESNRPALARRDTEFSTRSRGVPSVHGISSQNDSSSLNHAHSNQQDLNTGPNVKPTLTINTFPPFSSDRNTIFNNRRTGTIGAPPQTPNDHSPDKPHSCNIGNLYTEHRCSDRRADLPTPGTEELGGPEYDLHEHIDVPATGIVALSIDATGLPENHTKNGSNNFQINNQLFSVENLGSNQLHDFVVDTNQHEKMIYPNDPRLHRQGQRLDPLSARGSTTSSSVIITTQTSPQAPTFSGKSGDATAPSNDDPSRPSVKRCQRCQKQVFGTDICRVCSSGTSIDISARPDVTPPSMKAALQAIKNITNRASGISHAETQETSPQSPSKSSRKRSISGSHVFLKNKRPKSSIICSSSGSIRPDAFTRRSAERRIHVNIPRPEIRREPTRTLDDLIKEERAKNNNKRRDSTALDDDVEPYSAYDAEKGTPVSYSTARPSTDITDMPSTSPAAKHIFSNRVTDGIIADSLSDLFSSPSQLSSSSLPSAAKLSTIGNTEIFQKAQSPEAALSSKRPSRNAQLWRKSESPDPTFKNAEAKDKAPTLSATITSSQLFVQVEAEEEEDDEELYTPSSRSRSIAKSPPKSLPNPFLRPGNFTAASSTTCSRCRKHHKKCVHDAGGNMNETKCREYVLSRGGRPDSGRSRAEWAAIVEAAQLSADSDDGSEGGEDLSDSEPEPASRPLASDSEDDFATALDGNETVRDHEDDDHRMFVEEVREPHLAAWTSPRFKSPTAITKTLPPTQHVKPARITYGNELRARERRGLMFESASEDDDYLSDHAPPPIRAERPVDPLFVPPKYSSDLFEVAPELEPRRLMDLEAAGVIVRRPGRKQQWAELRSQRLQERREMFGNPHAEVDRKHPDVKVSALVERIVPPRNAEDIYAVASVQIKEEGVSMRDFLGGPKLPEIRLTNDGERLAFQDGQKGRDRTFGRTGRGLEKRTTEDEKWPVRMK